MRSKRRRSTVSCELFFCEGASQLPAGTTNNNIKVENKIKKKAGATVTNKKQTTPHCTDHREPPPLSTFNFPLDQQGFEISGSSHSIIFLFPMPAHAFRHSALCPGLHKTIQNQHNSSHLLTQLLNGHLRPISIQCSAVHQQFSTLPELRDNISRNE